MAPKRKSLKSEEEAKPAKQPKTTSTKVATGAAKGKSKAVKVESEKSKPASAKTAAKTVKHYPKHVKESDEKEVDELTELDFTEPIPKRNAKNELVFPDYPDFRPNMTPKEVLQAGSFGGTYYRPIKSSITGKSYTGVWKELPKDWLEGLDIGKQVSASMYNEKVNKYKAKCDGSLQMWEESGWMHKQDPYGWYQWFCRFYQGRRTEDDERQIGRWLRCAGTTGRWRNNLIAKCVRSGCAFDNFAVSPVVRQTLQHWAYTVTKEHFDVYAKKMKQKGKA